MTQEIVNELGLYRVINSINVCLLGDCVNLDELADCIKSILRINQSLFNCIHHQPHTSFEI